MTDPLESRANHNITTIGIDMQIFLLFRFHGYCLLVKYFVLNIRPMINRWLFFVCDFIQYNQINALRLISKFSVLPYNCWYYSQQSHMNIFRVTGPLCGEFTCPRWIPLTKASDTELCCFFDLRLNEPLSKQSWGWWFETPLSPLWRQCNAELANSARTSSLSTVNSSEVKQQRYINFSYHYYTKTSNTGHTKTWMLRNNAN